MKRQRWKQRGKDALKQKTHFWVWRVLDPAREIWGDTEGLHLGSTVQMASTMVYTALKPIQEKREQGIKQHHTYPSTTNNCGEGTSQGPGASQQVWADTQMLPCGRSCKKQRILVHVLLCLLPILCTQGCKGAYEPLRVPPRITGWVWKGPPEMTMSNSPIQAWSSSWRRVTSSSWITQN